MICAGPAHWVEVLVVMVVVMLEAGLWDEAMDRAVAVGRRLKNGKASLESLVYD